MNSPLGLVQARNHPAKDRRTGTRVYQCEGGTSHALFLDMVAILVTWVVIGFAFCLALLRAAGRPVPQPDEEILPQSHLEPLSPPEPVLKESQPAPAAPRPLSAHCVEA